VKINNDPRIPTPPLTAGNVDRTRKAAKAGKAYARSKAAAGIPVGTDRVEVSDKARAMQVAMAALKQTPQIRADKVAALKARIKTGSYLVSGEDVAERMLADDTSG
jgi:negative regulator of flagellin synthesis FlgM